MTTRRTLWSIFNALTLAVVLLVAPRPSQAQVTRVGWTPVVSALSGQCLDVQAGATQSGAAVVQSACQPTPSQQWALEPVSNGFVIVQRQTQLCITASGTSVIQADCGGTGSTWTLSTVGNAVRLMSATSQLCIAPSGGSAAASSTLSLAACSGSTVPTWVFQSGLTMPNQLSTLQANNSGQCLSIGPTWNIVQNPCAGTPFQQWHFVPTAQQYQYQIVLSTSPYCLTAVSAAAGSKMMPATCNTTSNQTFVLTPSTSGYMLVVPYTTLCVHVDAASLTPGSEVVLATCNNAQDQLWSMALSTVPSKWSGLIPLNNDPMAVANLPDGTLLTWTASSLYTFVGDIGSTPSQTYYSIFSPATSTSGPVRTDSASADMFCPGTANLADGRVLVNGGTSSLRTTIYDPATHQFAADANMNVPRGYEGDTPLSNGSVLTLGGSWNNTQGGKIGEVWAKGQGWAPLTGVPDDPFLSADISSTFADNHLWLFGFANGFVLHAGPGMQMHWISTVGSGAVFSAGPRADDAYSINGNAVMYDVAKILKVGGAPLYSGAAATAAAYTINVNANNGDVAVNKLAPMAYPRAFSNSVALPNGQVVVVGGQTYAKTFSDDLAVLVPELWDPLTGVFQQLAPMQTARTYHSTAILLNDGRVFVGGGWQCGYACTPDHYNAEILSPPYLLNADGSAATRPAITAAPTTAPPGSTITVTTDSPIASFVLMRSSSVTHSLNNDQRRIPLVIQSSRSENAGNTYTLSIPADTGVVLPGAYMLFAMNPYGTPSVSSSILVH